MSAHTVFVDPPTITRAQARARAARLEPRASDDGRETSVPFHACERLGRGCVAVVNVSRQLKPASVP